MALPSTHKNNTDITDNTHLYPKQLHLRNPSLSRNRSQVNRDNSQASSLVSWMNYFLRHCHTVWQTHITPQINLSQRRFLSFQIVLITLIDLVFISSWCYKTGWNVMNDSRARDWTYTVGVWSRNSIAWFRCPLTNMQTLARINITNAQWQHLYLNILASFLHNERKWWQVVHLSLCQWSLNRRKCESNQLSKLHNLRSQERRMIDVHVNLLRASRFLLR